MMAHKNIWVVIPNFNGADMIEACLRSLEQQSLKPRIIVVDNGSTDNSVATIRKNFPEVMLLEFPNNAGFAGGVNRGIRYALQQGAPIVALFNNDAVADKNWLENLAHELDSRPKAGITTGKLLRTDKKHLDSTGEFYSVWGMPFPRGRNHVDTNQYNKVEEVFAATGGASLYCSSMLKEIGLFDEDFFAYYEDVDISFRAQAAGWKVWYVPSAIAYHGIGGTSSRMGDLARYHSAKNFLLLYARNMPRSLYFKYLPLYTLQWVRLLLGSIAHRKFPTFAKGTWAAIMLHGKTKAVRRENLRRQRIKNSQLDHILTHSRPPRIPKI